MINPASYSASSIAGYSGALMHEQQLEAQQRRTIQQQRASDDFLAKQRQQLLDSGGGSQQANPFGAVPTVSQDNRFASGLTDAETRLRTLLDNPDSIQQTGAYKFRVQQGQEALQRSMGAKGMLNSGNRLMELTKYGQDMGSQEYDNQAGRLSSLLGNYSQGYLGDKNANTSRFAAEAGAWNTAQGNADQNRYRMDSLAWDMSKPQGGGGGGSRSLSGMTNTFNPGGIGGNTPVDWTAFRKDMDARQQYLDRY